LGRSRFNVRCAGCHGQDGLGGEHFRPPTVLVELVDTGHLGQKTGQGFYTYPREPAAGPKA